MIISKLFKTNCNIVTIAPFCRQEIVLISKLYRYFQHGVTITLIYLILICSGFKLDTTLFASDFFLLTDIGASAETIGKGSIEGFNLSSSSIFENPAGIYRLDNVSMTIFTTNFMGEITYNNISLSGKTSWGNIGVGYMEYGAYRIPHTGRTSQNTHYVKDYFDARVSITKFCYQYSPTPTTHIGSNINLYQSQAHDLVGSGFDLDIGCIINTPSIEYSLFARNIIPNHFISYSNAQKELFPVQVIGGVRYRYYDADFYAQASLKDHHLLPALGLKYNPFSNSIFYLTSGVRSNLNGYKRQVMDYNIGLLLELSELSFSYALEKSEFFQQDYNHFFTVGINY